MNSDLLEDQYALIDRVSEESLEYYLDSVIINCQPEPKRFGLVAEWWQKEILSPKIPAVEGLAGIREYKGPLSFLTILPRGHDKSSLEGRIVNYLLCYSRRLIDGYILAEDKDQGKLIVERMKVEADLNPWLSRKLRFSKYEVSGPKGGVKVIPADAKSAFGLTGNLYICDEITNWAKSDVWSAVVSGREKVPGTLLIGITNAGMIGSWQDEKVYQTAKMHPEEWVVYERRGQLASWMSKERIDLIRPTLTSDAEARRVLDNEWIDPAVESGYLNPSDVDRCVQTILNTHSQKVPGFFYVLGIDYGPLRDRTALSVVHLDRDGRIVVDVLDVWQGNPKSRIPVPIDRVENWIHEKIKLYRPSAIVIDPFQMEGTIQKFQADREPVIPFNTRGGAGNMELTMRLRELISGHRLLWKAGTGDLPGTLKNGKPDTFRNELVSLVVKWKTYGFRFDHEVGFHDDRAVAVGMAAAKSLEFPPSGNIGNIPPGIQTQPPWPTFVNQGGRGGNPLMGG